jgi:VWFA-related protein
MRYIKLLPVLLIALCGLFFTPVQASQQQEQPQQIEEEDSQTAGRAAIRMAVNQIRVDVTVTDNKGNLITGLKQEHFSVYEDKVKQEITFFEPIEAPMTAVLIVEYSKVLPWEWLYEAILASYSFVQQIRRGDWIAVIAYDIRPEILVDFTQNPNEVQAALRRLNYPAYRESNLYDTIYDTLDRVQELDQRTAIVLLTTGLDTFSKKNLGETLDRVKRANTVIYTVSLGGNLRARAEHRMSSLTRLDFYQADATLKAFAKYTGGETFFPRFLSEYSGIFETISLLLRNQYSLGYVSSNTKKDGKYRKIKVEVNLDLDGDGKKDKFKVRHREGYLTEKVD